MEIGPDFAAGLKDGVILCTLVNKIRPGSVKNINKGKMPFQQMENIGNYLKACQALGMKSTDLFQTVDLYEAKNMTQFYDDARTQVVQNIHALGRVAQKMPGYTGPVIGVRESDKHNDEKLLEQIWNTHRHYDYDTSSRRILTWKEVQFTEEQLRQGQGTLGLLQSGQKEHAYSGVDRSKDVNRNYQQQWK